MTEKEARERVEKYIKSFNGNALDCVAIGTVLTFLEKKDKEIQFQKEINKTEQNRHKQTEKSLKGQLKKKDKMIDEMAEYLASIDFDEHCVEVPGICMGCPKEDDLDGYMQCIKQYYKRKVEG